MDVISLSAIKKAKKEIVAGLEQTTISIVLELRDKLSKLDEKLSTGDFNQMMASIQEHFLSKLDASISSRVSKADFDRWKAPWTAERAGKIDNLDASVSSRLSGHAFGSWKEEQEAAWQPTKDAVSRMDGRIDRSLSELASKSTQGEMNTRLKNFLPPAQKVVFASPGSHKWQCPEGIEKIIVEIGGASGGGGGSGGGANFKGFSEKSQWHSVPGAAGGRGGYARITLRSIPGKSYDIQIGGKGVGGSAGLKGTGKYIYNDGLYYCQGQPGGDGTTGGYSSFEDYIAYGGGGGKGGEGSIAYDKPIDKWEVKALGGSSGDVSANFLTFADKIVIEPESGKDSTPKKYEVSDNSKKGVNGVKGTSIPLVIWGHTMQGGAGGNAVFANNYPYAKDGEKGRDGTDGIVVIHYV